MANVQILKIQAEINPGPLFPSNSTELPYWGRVFVYLCLHWNIIDIPQKFESNFSKNVI